MLAVRKSLRGEWGKAMSLIVPPVRYSDSDFAIVGFQPDSGLHAMVKDWPPEHGAGFQGEARDMKPNMSQL